MTPRYRCNYQLIPSHSVTVSPDESARQAICALYLAYNLPLGGQHVARLEEEQASLYELGLGEKLIRRLHEAYDPPPTAPDAAENTCTIGALALLGAADLYDDFQPNLLEIIERLDQYAVPPLIRRAPATLAHA